MCICKCKCICKCICTCKCICVCMCICIFVYMYMYMYIYIYIHIYIDKYMYMYMYIYMYMYMYTWSPRERKLYCVSKFRLPRPPEVLHGVVGYSNCLDPLKGVERAPPYVLQPQIHAIRFPKTSMLDYGESCDGCIMRESYRGTFDDRNPSWP